MTIYRTSMIRDTIVVIVFSIILFALLVFLVREIYLNGFSYLIFFVCLWFIFFDVLFLILASHRLLAGKRDCNWLLLSTPDGLLIKYRSFLNHHYDESDLVIIKLLNSEINWARQHNERIYKDRDDAIRIERYTYLELKLNLSETEFETLKQHLQQERELKPLRSELAKLNHELFKARKQKVSVNQIEDIKRQRQHLKLSGSKNKSRAKHHDYPVRLLDNHVLQIRWNAIKPGIRHVLSELSGSLLIDEPISTVTDNSQPALLASELEDRILNYIHRGDQLDAIMLIRQYYGYSLVEAKRFIEELSIV